MPNTKLLEERVTLRTVVTALCVLILSVVLLYVGSQSSWWTGREAWQTLLQQIGSSLFTLAGLTFLWELIAKRAFLDEMLAKTRIAKDLLYSGVAQITDSFHEEVDWVGMFHDASKIDIFFAYGATWRNRHTQKLKDFLIREKSRLRVVLPDLSESQTTLELARRFNTQESTLIDNIRAAEEFFISLREGCGPGSVVEVWRYPGAPLFSMYRFDNSMVLTTYTHRRTRCPIPTFVCRNTGSLFAFLYDEFQAMIAGDHPLAKRRDG